MKLRQYQKEAIQAIKSFLDDKENNNKNPVVSMATGSGKSLIIAYTIKLIRLHINKKAKFIMCTHVKELVEQNLSKLLELNNQLKIGICSAGISATKDYDKDIVFATIKTIKLLSDKVDLNFDYCLIDECHLVSENPNTYYITFLNNLKKINPNIKIIGYTATPFRTKTGFLYENHPIFNCEIYNNTQGKKYNQLIEYGYLSTLINVKYIDDDLVIDTKNIKINKITNDYKEKELIQSSTEFIQNTLVIDNIIKYADKYNLKKWLIFCCGIEDSEILNEKLIQESINSYVFSSNLKKSSRDQILYDYKLGNITCLVNCNILTTGIDVPDIDYIVMLRPTKSHTLWIQMLGRGTRVADNKKACYVLNFTDNTKRLGTINEPIFREKQDRISLELGIDCPQCKEKINIKKLIKNKIREDELYNYYLCTTKKCEHIFKYDKKNNDKVTTYTEELITDYKFLIKNIKICKFLSKKNKITYKITYKTKKNKLLNEIQTENTIYFLKFENKLKKIGIDLNNSKYFKINKKYFYNFNVDFIGDFNKKIYKNKEIYNLIGISTI